MDLGGAGGVQVLKRIDAEGMIDQSADAAGGGLRGGKRGDAGDAITHGGATDGFLVVKGLAAQGRIDDQIDAAGFHQVHDIGAAFVGFVDAFGANAAGGERRGGAAGGQQGETKLREVPRQGRDVPLIVIVDADENRALAGKLLAGR